MIPGIRAWFHSRRVPAPNLAMKRTMHRPAAKHFHWRRIGILLSLLASGSTAAPDAAFPINSQVPPVARVARPYQFVFSASTFTSFTTELQYTLSNAPEWLQFDGTTRTFHGTPGKNDVGPAEFNLVATDSTGSTNMPVTFVVSTGAGPTLGVSVLQQLATLGTFSQPSDLLFYPSSPIMISFGQDTFSNTDLDTVYYAICANNTPLPSWITFDASQLQLAGTTPAFTSPTELPQRFGIQLMASDVVGFSAAATSFQLVVTSHELTFGSVTPKIIATPGKPVNFTAIQTGLTLDQQPIQSHQLDTITADLPEWLSLHPQSLAISGTPPENAISQNCIVTANDTYGDTVQTTISILIAGSSSLIEGDIGTVKATIGSSFEYRFNQSLFVGSDLNISVSLGNASRWLNFDRKALLLSGQVPNDLSPQQDQLDLTASTATQAQTQRFLLSLVSANNNHGGNTINSATSDIAVPSATTTSDYPSQTGLNMISTTQVNGRTIAVAVVVSVAVVFLAVLFLWWLRKRLKRKARGSYLDALRRQISQPYLQTLEEPSEKTTENHTPYNFSSHWPEIPRFNRNSFLASIPGAKRQSQASEHKSGQQVLGNKGTSSPIRTGVQRLTDNDTPFYSMVVSPSASSSLQGHQSQRGKIARHSSCRLNSFGYGVTNKDVKSAHTGSRQTKHFSRSTSLRSIGHGRSRGSIEPLFSGSPTFSGARNPWHNKARSSDSSTVGGALEMFPPPPCNSIVRVDTPARSHRSSRNRYPRDYVFFSGRDSSSRESRINKKKYVMSSRLESYSEDRPNSSCSNKENNVYLYIEDNSFGTEDDHDTTHETDSAVLRDASSSGQRKGMMMQGLIAPSLSRASSQALPPHYQHEHIHVQKRRFKQRTAPSASPLQSVSCFDSTGSRLRLQGSKGSLTSSQRFGSANDSEPPSDSGDVLLAETDEEGPKRRVHPHPLRSHESLGQEYRVEKLNPSKGKRAAGAGNVRGARSLQEGSGSEGDASRIVLGQRGKRVSVVDEDLVRGREVGRSRKAMKAFI